MTFQLLIMINLFTYSVVALHLPSAFLRDKHMFTH